MRKFLSVLLSASLVLSSLVMFASAVGAESKFKITEDPAIAASVKAYVDIKQALKDKKPLTEIKATYESVFQADVKRLDAAIKVEDPKIDENITFILDGAIEGKLEYLQANEAIQKGILWYYYFFIRDLMSKSVKVSMTSGDTAAAKVQFDKVVQVYENVFLASATSRDTQFKTTMVENLKASIELVQKDIADSNLKDFNIHRQILDKTLMKFFALATYNYAGKLPTVPVADIQYEMTEAYLLFMPIYSYFKVGSPADAEYVKEVFGSGDITKVDKTKLGLAIQRMMIGKVSEYLTGAITKLDAKDLEGARGTAMEGIMFVSTQEVFLGPEKYAAVSVVAEKFREAIDNSNAAEARKLSQEITAYLVGTDGLKLTINSTLYQVDGVDFTAAAAPYVNYLTNRTLVPVRLISDALLADVSYDVATKTVKIVKDGKTTELKVGSDQVIQDGKVSETVKLDQPVLIKNNSSFIPLRAIVELFGKKVFFNNGEINVLR
ncbi:copper amine oxidase N-terminal domain-containing protein [Paenibacillus psychroresistens]|uniref:Copper amine oxidase N-terminal domain-containing protein n=1 Tax=Paenibacillus psychroresistens TaxID=1778678 RepID=A0A6B8RHB2_9BACL|nr:stalk domain-containing protein [Paenibacillus psychroresistens]QGQ95590.1 copper amine oxidase N-terminal domain-containing protein [Paenibacillus psychroresistens]